MRAATCFDGFDAGRWKGAVAVQELGVFAGEDVVGHGGDGVGVTEVEEEGEEKCGFARTYGAGRRKLLMGRKGLRW